LAAAAGSEIQISSKAAAAHRFFGTKSANFFLASNAMTPLQVDLLESPRGIHKLWILVSRKKKLRPGRHNITRAARVHFWM